MNSVFLSFASFSHELEFFLLRFIYIRKINLHSATYTFSPGCTFDFFLLMHFFEGRRVI